MSVKVTKGGKLVLGVLFVAALFAAKIFWWDKRPQDVQKSEMVGKVVIPDAPEASLGSNAVKLDFPSTKVVTNDGASIKCYKMAWQSQNAEMFANGGKQTTEGSLFDKFNLNVEMIRQDDCAQSCAELIKFCKDYKNDPKTPAVFITFMGSGIPAYITGISNAVKDLGPEYQPVAFMSTGKSYGEDQIMGDIKYKQNPQNLRGAVCVGYMMDGDNDIALKYANDNGVPCNTDGTTYDPEALNFMYCKDFLDAVQKYNNNYTESRKIVKNGRTTGKDTVVGADIVATWTPGDVNARNGRGGVTIASTKQYASMMPNITITCKKWLNDHRTDAENYIIASAMAGDQIRSFEDAKRYACKLNVDVYGEQSEDYWYRYYNGVKADENTQLGGSMVFNLADMANLFGLSKTNSNDIYKAVYNTFGTLQAKYYRDEEPYKSSPNNSYLEYTKAFDKSILMSVISNHEDLLQGKANLVDYSKATTQIGNKSYQILFATGSAEILPESYSVLDNLFQSLTAADGTKIMIGGHTDNTGNDAINLSLSRERANSVKNYLLEKGLQANRMESEGYGSTKPKESNTTKEGQRKNRRVEITLLVSE
jgi:OOP family OmpA-OmpF porin